MSACLRAGALLLAWSLGGCILLIDDEASDLGLGTECRFDGDDSTDCGRCIAAGCQSTVDACCDAVGACGAQLKRLDECAGDASGLRCVHLSVQNPNAPPAGAALNACVESKCAATCPVAAANACPGIGQDDCFACCQQAFPRGRDVSFGLDIECACTPGFCTPECGLTAYCVSGAPIPGSPCFDCLARETVRGGRCTFAEPCSNDPDCLAFTTCFQACFVDG